MVMRRLAQYPQRGESWCRVRLEERNPTETLLVMERLKVPSFLKSSEEVSGRTLRA